MAYKFNPFTSKLDYYGTKATQLHTYVKNDSGVQINKGEAVYVSGANGTNVLVKKASNSSESTSSQTLGLASSDIAVNGFGYIVSQGIISNVDTSAAGAAGNAIYLGSTAGSLVYGLANKPSAPAHLVYVGTVTRKNANTGEIYVKMANGWELEELHNVAISSPTTGQVIKYNATTSLWENGSVTSSLSLTEYDNADKPSPSAGDVWVKHTTAAGAGTPVGLLLALTTPGSGVEKYELSYRTSAGTTKRVELT